MPTNYTTKLILGDEAFNSIANSVAKIAKPVIKTLGPNGDQVILDREGRAPLVTKDGITVLHDLEFTNGVDKLVYEIVRAEGEEINRYVGDGTTSVTFLTAGLISRLRKAIAFNNNPYPLVKGMALAEQAIRKALDELTADANTEEVIRSVIRTSANAEDEIERVLTEVFMEVGDDGMIFVRDGRGIETEVLYEEGFSVGSRIDTPELLDQEKFTFTWDKPYVLILREALYDPNTLVPLLEDIVRRGESRRLIIAYSTLSEQVINMFHLNNMNHPDLRIMSFRMPLYAERQKEYLEDLAALVDAKTMEDTNKIDLQTAGIEILGRCDEVSGNGYVLRFVGGRGTTEREDGTSRLQERLEFVRKDRDRYTGNYEERSRGNERLAKLSGAVVSIHPGGKTDIEMKRKRGVYEDAIRAVEVALQGGVIQGGGYGLYKAAKKASKKRPKDEDEARGFDIVIDTCQSLFEKLSWDAETRPSKILDTLDRMRRPFPAVNFRTMEMDTMTKIGVVDPVLLIHNVLEQSIATAKTMVLIGGIIYREAVPGFVSWKEQHARLAELKY